jgi:hypothetical protein
MILHRFAINVSNPPTDKKNHTKKKQNKKQPQQKANNL